MKIGLDVHGVITDYSEFFSLVSEALVEKGHEVHIITGRGIKEGKIKEKLKELNIIYTHLFSVVDSEVKKGTKVKYTNAGIWMHEKIWNSAKAKYCKEHEIDMMYDDDKVYAKYFEGLHTRFILVPRRISKVKCKNPFEEFRDE